MKALTVQGIIIFLVMCSFLSGTDSFARQNTDFNKKENYKKNAEATKKAPVTHKDKVITITKSGNKHDFDKGLPKGKYFQLGAPKGRPSSEATYNKTHAISPGTPHKEGIHIIKAKTNGVKISDQKGGKSGLKQAVPPGKTPKKNILSDVFRGFKK